MRISYWSSDVCSSDLQALLSVPSANEAQPGLATFCLGREGELLAANLSASDMLVGGDSPLRLRDRKLWLKKRSDREVMADRLAGPAAGKYAGGAAHWTLHEANGGIWALDRKSTRLHPSL